jgi:hypothetical protein
VYSAAASCSTRVRDAYLQDFLGEDRLISRVGDHLTGSLAEPKAMIITHL